MRRAINVQTFLKPGESQERLTKRFFKKCKKQEIIKEFLDKTSCFKTKTQRRKEKQLRNKYITDKEKSK